jgi:hypothetical protein
MEVDRDLFGNLRDRPADLEQSCGRQDHYPLLR